MLHRLALACLLALGSSGVFAEKVPLDEEQLRALQAGLKWCRIDLIELLTGLHVAALGK